MVGRSTITSSTYSNCFIQVSAFPSPEGFIGLADAAAIKVGIWVFRRAEQLFVDYLQEATTHRARFPKPVKLFKLMRAFGRNIVEAEGELWKRFRKSAAPAFSDVRRNSLLFTHSTSTYYPSQRNNALVWDETVRTIQELVDTVWSDRSEITAENAVDITRAVSLP